MVKKSHFLVSVTIRERLLGFLPNWRLEIFIIVKIFKNSDLNNKDNKNKDSFSINENIIDEINILDDKQILYYLAHRYRYEIYPQSKILDDYPPYLQIEPTSICNYRCVFCFETDKSFTNKKS